MLDQIKNLQASELTRRASLPWTIFWPTRRTQFPSLDNQTKPAKMMTSMKMIPMPSLRISGRWVELSMTPIWLLRQVMLYVGMWGTDRIAVDQVQ